MSRSARQDGFTIVEVLIAVVIVAIGLVGVTLLVGSTSQTASLAKVRDQQSAISQSIGDKLRGDSSWSTVAAWGGTAPRTCAWIAANSGPLAIDNAWIQQHLAAELATDGAFTEQWQVRATARPVDSPADGTCSPSGDVAGDADGIVPDYYDITVVVSPLASTATRFPGLKPFTLTFQVDFASRTAGGRLTIQACKVTPQIDERLPIGACVNSGNAMPVLPPAGSEYNGGDISCQVEKADCRAFECASPKLDGDCGNHGSSDFVSVRAAPAVNWTYTITGDTADPVTKGYSSSGRLDATGSASVPYLKGGRYRVHISPSGGYVPWESHSVPADGWATVVTGIDSRVVQMFKPKPRTTPLKIPITTVDSTIPSWIQPPPTYDYLYGKSLKDLILVSIPRGRTMATATPTDANEGDSYVVFDNLEPGLYAAYLSDPDLQDSKELGGTYGFIYVPENGDPIVMPSGTNPTLQVGYCDPDGRKPYENSIGPSGQPAGPCASPSGGPPPKGGGGSGSS